MDGLRVVEMLLPAALIFVPPHAVQRHISVQTKRVERLCMECGVILRDLFDANSPYTAHCIRKIVVNELFL